MKILLIQGHPDASQRHFCHALEAAYARGASEHGHTVCSVDVATLDFPLLRSQYEWEHGTLPSALVDAQEAIKWAEHLVLFFPLWLGDMPALLKGFLEQIARPGFAFCGDPPHGPASKGLAGRSARVVVTMGMPALIYRWYFRAHSIKSLERNILGFVGVAPVNETLIGMIGEMQPPSAEKWLARLEELGRQGN
ncbi:NAD(P)H-dependent oxidoreductase [Actimicrobium antarcticum]|uniref:NAD(P)H-dependent oxidoreductase n=2 Tax=Actimicrobium antarcticum TaxID=1051899 RepID=A0ABP7TN93_9BURK